MRNHLLAATAFTAVFLAAQPATAAVLTADTGWQDDTLTGAGDPTADSPWTFTITETSVLSVVDCCIAGDTYFLSGDLTGTTTFYAGLGTDVQAEGSYASYWLDSSYSKIALTVLAGTYTFSITGDGVGGVPAGLGVRLDTAGSVPEPATWAMMIAGFGLTGGALRRRQTRVTFA